MEGGPPLLLDKCALQSLSRAEAGAIPHCFAVNIPPILTLEILADLKKEKDLVKEKNPQHEVQTLAHKLALFDHSNNTHYRVLIEGELLGYQVEMRGVPILSGGTRVDMPDGTYGIVFDEHPDRARYRRWAEGTFLSEDETEATQWRQYSAKFNIQKLQVDLARKAKEIPAPPDLSTARKQVDLFLAKAPQFGHVTTIFALFNFSQSVREKVTLRWRKLAPHSLESYAPFCLHVLRVPSAPAYRIVHSKPSSAQTQAAWPLVQHAAETLPAHPLSLSPAPQI